MADTDQAMLVELQKLNRTVSAGGSMGAGSELKGGSAEPDASSAAKKESDEQAKLAKKIQTTISKSTNKYVAAQAAQLTSMKALRELAEKNSKKDLEGFLALQKRRDTEKLSLDKVNAAAVKLGFETKDLARSEADLRQEMDELERTVGDLDGAMAQQSRSSGLAQKALAALGAIALAVGKQMYDVAQTSMRTGIEMTLEQAASARMMGMTQVELMETQAKYRRVIESSGVSNQKFADDMLAMSDSMLVFTGDLKQGAIFAAEMNLTYRQLSATGMSLAEFTGAQADVFKTLHNTLSMTNEEFLTMNKQLMESQATRVQLFKMSKRERAQYAIGLAQTMAYLEVQGLQTEQAHKVVEAMQGIAGMDPKSRLKKAAQIQAMAGAMGMGAEGEELARLTRSGAQDPGSVQRMTELSQQINAAVQQRQGSSDLGQEMATSAVLNATGTGDLFGAQGAMADLTLAEALKVDPNSIQTAENTTKIEEWQKEIFKYTQIIANFLQEGWVATIVGAITGLIAAYMGGGIMGTILGAITSIGSGIVTGVTTLMGGLMTLGTSLLGGFKNLAGSLAKGAGNLAKAVGPRLVQVAKFARVAAAPAAAAAAAAYGVQQAYQAITTGRSDVNDMLNSTETGRSVGEAIGSSIAHTLAFFGNDAAQEAIEINRKLEEQQAQSNSIGQEMVASQRETNALQRRQIQTTEAQTEAVVGTTTAANQQQNRNRRSYNMRSRGRAPVTPSN